ncbi:isoprenoid synthase domain-containing protein [Suillus occidentalis]|nr:isoprenoid synthase domain-containing protein [Suillus occidentalis]
MTLSSRSRCLQRLNRRLHTGSALRSEAGISSPAEYCKDLVRKHDYEGGYFALRAFYDKPPRHPIALAIHETTRDNHLPLYHFNRIVEARVSKLFTAFACDTFSLESMTSHAESTSSTFLYLLLAMLNLPSSTLAHAASHIGVAQSLTTLLRALPFHASKGVMVIPAEITAKHNVNQQEIFTKRESSHGLEDAVFELATIANDHLLTARDMFKESGGRVPPDAMPVFSAAIPVVSILSRLEAVNFNVFNPSLQIRDWRLAWQVWRSYYKRTF